MPSFIVLATNDVFLRSNAPTASAIEASFKKVQRRSSRSWGSLAGDWVGQHPRVTRVTHLISSGGRVTRAAWLFEFPDIPPGASLADIARVEADRKERLRTQLIDNLRRDFPDVTWTVELLPYDPAVHGSRAWWETDAWRTQTRDEFNLNQQVGLDNQENATGPTESALQPPTLGGSASALQLASTVKTVAWLAVVAGVLIYAGPLIKLGVSAFAGLVQKFRGKGAARTNPVPEFTQASGWRLAGRALAGSIIGAIAAGPVGSVVGGTVGIVTTKAKPPT